MSEFRSQTIATLLRSSPQGKALRSSVLSVSFSSRIPVERRFKVANLFRFQRGRADLLFSAIIVVVALLLLATFFDQSGWADRDLPQKRLGKVLKQPWIGPLIALLVLLPAAVGNLALSLRRAILDRRKHRPNKTRYEVVQWLRGVEFIVYFIVYTRSIEVVGYLIATVVFAVLMVMRLGYRSWRWVGIAAMVSFLSVVFFRSLLQIKTPVNIWLYNQLPDGLERFMKVYF